MNTSIAPLDWWVIGLYLFGLVAMAAWLARRQADRADYYVGGRNLGAWPVAVSVMATQCSSNSILGAPAFVAFAAGGGLVWLQYELALPLAMITLMFWVMPTFRRLGLISVYEYLELRFDLRTRLALSGLFLLVRAFATAVTVYGIALVIDLLTGIGFFASVILLGAFTVIYDTLGGIRGVVYSDVLQMVILVAVLLLLAIIMVLEAGGLISLLQAFDADRRVALDFRHHGLGDGHDFAFWPMLFGGFFLYLAYYGCDQSQVQRQLSTRNAEETNRALLINGFLRFPVVALYCLVGVGIGVYAAQTPEFLGALPSSDGRPEYNLAVPVYMLQNLPVGLVGLALVALFAAAMSSLDSVINSLSATTMEDFVRRFRTDTINPGHELWLARAITVFWGVVTLSMAFVVGDIAPTVLEAINKIGSLANGPILAVFALGLLTKRTVANGAIIGLLLGLAANMVCWLWFPGISWLWWNVLGFAVTSVSAYLISLLLVVPTMGAGAELFARAKNAPSPTRVWSWYLLLWFVALALLLWLLGLV